MNKFRTKVPISKFPFKISHNNQIMCIGSCFTEHIGGFLNSYKFNTLINPSGIVYNPISICKTLNQIIDGKLVDESHLNSHNERYSHWDFHGDYSRLTIPETLNKLNQAITAGQKYLDQLDYLFITLGTSNAFKHKSENRIVANCHKFPNDQFERVSLSPALIQRELSAAIIRLQSLRPNLKVVFTVSPVRHIRDGIVENQLSKAKLILTAHQLSESLKQVYYFPSYELVMDDLRDYRFYNEDMIHINKVGLNYIWEYFQNSFFDPDTINLNKEISSIQKDISHKPFHPQSEGHQNFLKQLLSKIKDLKEKQPILDLAVEEESIRNKIIS